MYGKPQNRYNIFSICTSYSYVHYDFMTYFVGPVSIIVFGVLQLPIISLQPSITSSFLAMFTNCGGPEPTYTPRHGL